MHRRTRRGGFDGDGKVMLDARGGGRKKMMRTRRRTRRGGFDGIKGGQGGW